MKKSLTSEEVSTISNYFSKNSQILAIYLMGSAARESLKPGSDIDLGILPIDGEEVSSSDLMKFIGDLGYELGFDFDLGILGSRNLVYSKEAIFKGRCIFTKDEIATKKKINTLLSMYYNFQFERRDVLNAYRVR
ncbi:nucleotidyltransferase domain-containing protein [Leptospira sp. GIMC2001]|uniref:nucleotidyltransferase domain-containing protein n=1 Tax=Leptospira sp. GIMC2001 TaxID=1513297 RepID=UPI0023492EC3|nr:nucleotidyltransferase domain-containing protein [Leptospira sp. GIMC2001]WCL51190.1 nucleotidyltransferase domain-containing protein [Leptospira sp. GIMC2001]